MKFEHATSAFLPMQCPLNAQCEFDSPHEHAVEAALRDLRAELIEDLAQTPVGTKLTP